MSIFDWISAAFLIPAKDEELEEWVRHHNDPRSSQGVALVDSARQDPNLTAADLFELWRKANALVGKRAPADYGEFLAYGYIEGRQDALNLLLLSKPSPSRKEGWDELDGLSPLEQYNREGR